MDRPTTDSEESVGIAVYSAAHSNGLAYLYKNDSADYMLDEEVGFPGLVGLKIEGEADGAESVVIKLPPGQQRLLKLAQIDANIKW